MKLQTQDIKPSDWPPFGPYEPTLADHTYTPEPANSSLAIAAGRPTSLPKKPASWSPKKGRKTKDFNPTPSFHFSSGDTTTDEATPAQRRQPRAGGGDGATPLVTRGANGHGDSKHTVQCDWLRLSGPISQRHKAIRLMESFFGEGVPGNGNYFRNTGHHIGDAGIYWDEGKKNNSERMVINIPGGMLSELGSNDLVHQVAHELMMLGCRATRFDVAVDFNDQPDLIDTALQSCNDGKLVGAKCYQHIDKQASNGRDGRTLYVGKRGKAGSGRYLRIYDKGLETGTKREGEWVRWEVEFGQDCAQQAAEAYATAANPAKELVEHAFGCCDWRENPGKKLARRPRCKWFAELIEGVDPTRVRVNRDPSTIYSKVRWFKQAVAPNLRTIQRVTGESMDRVLSEITGMVQTKAEKLEEPFVRGVCMALGVDPMRLHERYWAVSNE